MTLKGKVPAILLMAITIAVCSITCVDQSVLPLGTEAELTQLSIESGDVTSTTSKVGAVIPANVMEKEDITASDLYGIDYDKPGSDIGWADIKVRNKETGKINGRLRPVLSRGASAQWGIGTRTTRPDGFYDTRVPATLDSDEYIYIKVTSEDGEKTNYYRFYAKLLSWTTNLQYININNREGKAGASISGESTGGSAWDKASELTLDIALKEGQDALVVPTTFDPNATVKYAVTTDAATAPANFTPSEQRINIADQNYLYVEVTAENTIDKEYFKFKVSVGRIATIASLKLNKGDEDLEVYGLGLPQSSWNTVGFGEYQTADQPTAGFGIKLEMDDPDANFVYARIDNDSVPLTGADFGKEAVIRFTNDPLTNRPQSLAIKVTSANNVVTMYYKVRLMNLAANIKTQPKSAWYYRADVAGDGVSAEGKKAVAPLTVELDRPAKGSYTYQWYEADSWYGIYGRHGTSIDEKNNIATVNGGPGQYFYLVQPDEYPENRKADGYNLSLANYWVDLSRGGSVDVNGKPWGYLAWSIPGETSASYTPPTDWEDDYENITFYGTATLNNSFPVPPQPPKVHFFSGSTNESRYYWVTVTDTGTGLSVTSERALILTETDPDMDHFIFDLASLPKKNIIPFTKSGTDYDNVYQIDVRNYPFPADFEEKVKDYQICIAHAQYFLPDGRPWTQNWTHGNLHIGKGTSYAELEWWHNNMGANGGSIPLQAPHSSKGGLEVKPDWIGFTPSGDPAKGLPRAVNTAGDLPKGIYSMNATDPYPAGVAQGYFAAFIELLELRFQTAPKKED